MISTEINGRIAHLIINDGNLNIITPELASRLLQAVQFIESNQDVSALLIEGNGRSFSAGLDLDVLTAGGDAASKMLSDTGELLVLLFQSRLRIVSLCAGHAVAAGAMLLLVSDYRVGVSQSGKIGFSEVAHGFPLPELPILLAEARLNPSARFAATVLSKMYTQDDAREAGFLDVCMSNYRDARTHALQQADALSQLDDTAYLTTLNRVRGPVFSKIDALRSD